MAFLVINHRNSFAYLLSAQLSLIILLVFVGLIYISKIGSYSFPIKWDYNVYRLLYNFNVSIITLSRILNIGFAMIMVMCIFNTHFVVKFNKWLIILLLLPPIAFGVINDYEFQLWLHIYTYEKYNISYYGMGNFVFEITFFVYLIMPLAVSVDAALRTRIFAKRINMLSYALCFFFLSMIIIGTFVKGAFSALWFTNLNVTKIPVNTTEIHGYLYTAVAIVMIVGLLFIWLVFFKPFNLFEKASLTRWFSKNIYQNMNMLLHMYKNFFVTLGQQITIIKMSSDDREEVNRISDLSLSVIDEYMDFNSKIIKLVKKPEKVFVPIDIKECIMSAVMKTSLDSIVKYEVINDKPNARIMGSSEYVSEIFINLLLNSKDAVSKVNRPPEIKVTLLFENEYCMIEVCDNGEGIDAANKRKIFNPFFTTKQSGTGLGLSFVKRTVSQHNGKIRIISKKGRYTKFQIVFPLV